MSDCVIQAAIVQNKRSHSRLMLLVEAVLMFGVLAGDREDRCLLGQPSGGAGAVGKAAESRGGGRQLGGGQTGPVC